MGAHPALSVLHPEDLIQLREEIQPVREQDHDAVGGQRFQVSEYLPLGVPVQRRERVVQDQERPLAAEGPCKGQPLCLPAGQPHTAAAHKGIHALFHGGGFLLKADRFQIPGGVGIPLAQQDIVPDAVIEQLRVVAKVTHDARPLFRRQVLQLRPAEPDAALVGRLTQEGPPEGGFPAGHRAGHPDDLPRLRREGDAAVNAGAVRVDKAQIRNFQRGRFGRLHGFPRFRLLHQGPDPLPRHLRLVDGVEQLGRTGGLHRQLGETGQKSGEGGDVPCLPAGAQHVPAAGIQDEQHTGQRDRPVQRLHGGTPDVGLHRRALVGGQILLVGALPLFLAAVDPVGHGIGRPVQRGRTQPPRLDFECGPGALDNDLHFFGQQVGDGGEQDAQQGKPYIIVQQHPRIGGQSHAGIKDLGGELPHPLHAVVHIQDRLGHDAARRFLMQLLPAFMDQCAVEDLLHLAVDVVREFPDVEPLEIPRDLHHADGSRISCRQPEHLPEPGAAFQDQGKAARHLALEPRPCQKAQVVDEPRDGDRGQGAPFLPEIGEDAVGPEPLGGAFFRFHVRSHFPAAVPPAGRSALQAGGPHGRNPPCSLPWSGDRACPASGRRRRFCCFNSPLLLSPAAAAVSG